MWKSKYSLSVLVLAVLVLIYQPSRAETFKLALPPGIKGLFSYEFEVLEMALKYADGDHSFEFVEIPGLTQSRVLELLDHGEVSVTINSYSHAREERFLQVNYPLTRGLLGQRVFITRSDQADVLAHVTSLDRLKQFCIGASNDWPAAAILEENGFCVVEAPRKQLFTMLQSNRFDLLISNVKQADFEIELSKKNGYDFVINKSLMLVYPYDFFLYVRKDDLVRHAILEQGLERAYASGAFMTHFTSHPTMVRALEELRPSVRKVFHIENPEMSVRTRNIDPGLWMGF
ncbi:hypothetical protein [Thalassospira alkalitolerans]|uniref:hypothetical protein n=1 Tax=Thalassospira alkalitolerans TaxID=1293890 RepID=UPI000A1E990F|nr:hypothetical protein [Thalassospira alkalitolerans]